MQQVYQQQMETQASQAIKEAASCQGNNFATTTIDLEDSKNDQCQDAPQMSKQIQDVTSVNGVSNLLSTTSIANTNGTDINQEFYSSEDVEGGHKAAVATFSSELEHNEYNYIQEDRTGEVNLDLEDDDDGTDDDDNLDDDEELDEEGVSHRVKTEDHECSEECGFCCDEEDSKYRFGTDLL